SFSVVKSAQEQDDGFIYDSQSKRDPFIALVTPDGRLLHLVQQQEEEKKEYLSLQGIMYYEEGSSYAIINQEIVKANDRVGEYLVYKVERSKVILVKGHKYMELKLEKEEEMR
ncbi:MAG: hypothetical protein DRP74_05615, partial [Candidatus Omnitrophota bacterium]